MSTIPDSSIPKGVLVDRPRRGLRVQRPCYGKQSLRELLQVAITYIEDGAPNTAIDRLRRALRDLRYV